MYMIRFVSIKDRPESSQATSREALRDALHAIHDHPGPPVRSRLRKKRRPTRPGSSRLRMGASSRFPGWKKTSGRPDSTTRTEWFKIGNGSLWYRFSSTGNRRHAPAPFVRRTRFD